MTDPEKEQRIDRAVDSGTNHPDYRSYRDSELAAPHGSQ